MSVIETPDWTRLWASPGMLALRRDRRSFFTVAWTIFALAFALLVGFAAFAPEIIAKRPLPGLSIGLILGLSYVVTVMSLAAWYARRARRWDALAADAVADGNEFHGKEEVSNV